MAPSPTLRRLLKETAELSSTAANPNPAFHAAPVSDSDLHEWHFTLLGPPAPSPYAGGLYHGRITLPATYPLKPPNFRFLTPSGRFETNREICLSISGFHEETWMPAWGVRTALTALRSFMAEKGTAGQVGGLEAGKEVRERLAAESKKWRCEACGRRSNEEIMNEWWLACREQGVKVDEADMGLESLPEGMNLEARDPNAKNKKDGGTQNTPTTPSQQVPVVAESASTAPSPPIPLPTIPRSTQTAVPAPLPASPTPSTPQHHTSSPSRTRQPPSSPTPAHNTLPLPPLAMEEPPSNTTIDRAIGALLLALAIMLLKKYFYPTANPVDDFYLND